MFIFLILSGIVVLLIRNFFNNKNTNNNFNDLSNFEQNKNEFFLKENKDLIYIKDENLDDEKISEVFKNKKSIFLMIVLFSIFISIILFFYYKISF